jgi:ribonuclease HIII
MKMLNKELVNELVDQDDQEVNYYLIDNFSDEEYIFYLPEILKTIRNGEGYFAKNAIERMPVTALADSAAQTFFSANFSELNYFAQVALLKKLTGVALTDSLIMVLKNNLDERNTLKNDLIRQLIQEG